MEKRNFNDMELEKVEDLELMEVEDVNFEPVVFTNAQSRCCGRGC